MKDLMTTNLSLFGIVIVKIKVTEEPLDNGIIQMEPCLEKNFKLIHTQQAIKHIHIQECLKMAILLLYEKAMDKMDLAMGYLVKCSLLMGIKKGVKFKSIAIHKTNNITHQQEFYQMDVLFVFDVVIIKMDLVLEFMAKFIIRI